ncbi:hypothetical protein Syun_005461 [Stephania yunnanensis]|uniref:pectinesterase n=1 Tax=Stephania yunnanensis TaxID=152371 RepID=A0AAP0Q3H0_9MAGN
MADHHQLVPLIKPADADEDEANTLLRRIRRTNARLASLDVFRGLSVLVPLDSPSDGSTSGGYFHGTTSLTFGVDIESIRCLGILQVKCGVRGDLGPACNSARMIDRRILGLNHLYRMPAYKNLEVCTGSDNFQVLKDAPPWCHAPFDPEGILSSFPAAITSIIGLHYGHVLVRLEAKERKQLFGIIEPSRSSFSLVTILGSTFLCCLDSELSSGYGKVDEADEIAFRKQTKRRLIVIAVSTIAFIGIVGAIIGTVIHKSNNKNGANTNSNNGSGNSSPNSIIRAVCGETIYSDACFSSLSSFKTSNHNKSILVPPGAAAIDYNMFDPEDIFKLSLEVALNELSTISTLPDKLMADHINDTPVITALKDCRTLFGDAMEEVYDSIHVSRNHDSKSTNWIDDVRTWLSAVLTDLETCVDGLVEMSPNNTSLLRGMETWLRNSRMYTSNSLAIVTNIVELVEKFSIPMRHRKLLSDGGDNDGYPDWMDGRDYRKLLGQNVSEINVDLTVAKDGTGTHTSIQDAVNAVKTKKPTRTVIYVKAGLYLENVVVGKEHWNIVMLGEGSANTIVSGSFYKTDHTSTLNCGTVLVEGKGFVARDIGFKNTAGPEKHQAVALRSSADLSVFYRCAFDAYQDTLYAHKKRQFYRDCFITGTVDFIFGNAAVIFQKCDIQPRQPLPNQYNTVTAQGRTKDNNDTTGISIDRCTIAPNGHVTAKTYLGRPWKECSTTVIMDSYIDGIVDPVGWIEWSPGTEPPSTIYYAEHKNSGPGAALENRVKWAGYRPVISDEEAHKFTVEPFIHGSRWLPHYIVPFNTD